MQQVLIIHEVVAYPQWKIVFAQAAPTGKADGSKTIKKYAAKMTGGLPETSEEYYVPPSG